MHKISKQIGFKPLTVFSVALVLAASTFAQAAPSETQPRIPASAADRALYAAAASGDIAAARRTLADGARINSTNAPWNDTALMIAADKSAPMLKWLIEHDADVNQQNRRGQTALMIAAYAGNTEAVTALLGKDADVHVADHWGDTALTQAVFRGDRTIVLQLAQHGADPDYVNNQGETPRKLAKRMVDLVEIMDDNSDHAHKHSHDDKDHVVTDRRSALRERSQILKILSRASKSDNHARR